MSRRDERSEQWSDRWSGRVESSDRFSLQDKGRGATNAKDYSRLHMGGSRISARRLAELAEELTERDLAVLFELARLRVLSGAQLEHLGFTEITPGSRGRVRRRVMARLVRVGLVATLERRVGGVRAGSAGLIYTLTGAGWRLVDLNRRCGQVPRRRTRETPGALFLAHALAISQTYVDLVEAVRARPGVGVEAFDVEADARWRDEAGEVLRPDALSVLSAGEVEDVWWLEVDRSTESSARIRRMLERYQRFAEAGETGPRGVIPRVLITVIDRARLEEVRRLIGRGEAPERLLQVVMHGEAAGFLVGELAEGANIEPP